MTSWIDSPSGPGAPRLSRTFLKAPSMLTSSTTRFIKKSVSSLKAGFSARAAAVDPGRDRGPVVSVQTSSDRYRATCAGRLLRCEFADGSSLCFTVWSFPFRCRSFGILSLERFQSRTGDLQPLTITPVPGVPMRWTRSCGIRFFK